MNKLVYVKQDICLKNHLIEWEYLINGGLIQILKLKLINHSIIMIWYLIILNQMKCINII